MDFYVKIDYYIFSFWASMTILSLILPVSQLIMSQIRSLEFELKI